MKCNIYYLFLILTYFNVHSQNEAKKWKCLRLGVIYGFSSQNKLIKQDSDYLYENTVYKISSHFNVFKKKNYSCELIVEPSYYNSKHKLINYWFISHTVENGDELRNKYMPLKSINEYVLNLGLLFRKPISTRTSIYGVLNVGPMYIDTDTERLKKGFAFSDIISLGANYRINKLSFDTKFMIRHVSNANIQKPNYGLNSMGFEFGTYYEFN